MSIRRTSRLAAATGLAVLALAATGATAQAASAAPAPTLKATVHGGDYLSATHPMIETLTITNHTGAALTDPIWRSLWLSNAGSDEQTIQDTDILLQTWQDGHWAAWTDDNLGELPNGLANGAHASITIRFQLVSQTMTTPTGHITLDLSGGVQGPDLSSTDTFALTKVFTVRS